MSNSGKMEIEKIEKLIEVEVRRRIDTELERRRPEIEAEIRTQAQALLAELRPLTEQAVRAELAETLLRAVKVDNAPLTPQKTHEVLAAVLDPITAARGIKRNKRGWMCAFCGTQFTTPRAASIHARSCDQRAGVLNGTVAPAEPRPRRRRDVVRSRTCIKPGCEEKSKGPRHHHLCEEHLHAPRKQWQTWQKKDREARA